MSVQGVNITLGLPIIRFPLTMGLPTTRRVGSTASAESLLAAIEYASQLAQRRLEEEGAKGRPMFTWLESALAAYPSVERVTVLLLIVFVGMITAKLEFLMDMCGVSFRICSSTSRRPCW